MEEEQGLAPTLSRGLHRRQTVRQAALDGGGAVGACLRPQPRTHLRIFLVACKLGGVLRATHDLRQRLLLQ